ncbi:prenyltransferase-like protein [Aspergillus californicus]
MTVTAHPSTFSETRFLTDIQNASAALNAPYSQKTTQEILTTFHESFTRGCVLWRTTEQPNADLNYRVYERKSIDLVTVAGDAGLLEQNERLGNLIKSWSSLYGAESYQLCDFDASRGLVKFWVFLGGVRPLDQVLRIHELPACIRNSRAVFEDVGLTGVRHTAVDLEKRSINLYFQTRGVLTRDAFNDYIALSGADPVEEDEILFESIQKHFPASGGTFAVTMDFSTGRISRVAFYALRLDLGDMPVVGERVQRFFDVCPSYDREEMRAIAWSFGRGKRYVKAEHSHSGELVGMLRGWRTAMTV